MRRIPWALLLLCIGCGGPAGPLRLETPHLRIRSGLPEAATREMADLLEQTVGAYRGLYAGVWGLKGDPPAVDVLLIPDPAEFSRTLEGLTGAKTALGTQGRYLHGNRTLYVNAACRGAAASAVHEFVHALDHVWAGIERPGNHPLWSYEGRCDDLGYAVRDGRIEPGAALFSRDTPEKLEKALSAPLPLRELVQMRGRDYYKPEGVNSHYALSWAFVHFLLHGDGGRHAEGFKRYLRGLPSLYRLENLEREIGPLDDLEKPFREHIAAVLLPGARAASP